MVGDGDGGGGGSGRKWAAVGADAAAAVLKEEAKVTN